MTKTETVMLGKEHDGELRRTVLEVLKNLGAEFITREWGIGGSQEIERFEVELSGHALTLEAETYVGLSITGERDVVQKVEAMVKRMSARAPTWRGQHD